MTTRVERLVTVAVSVPVGLEFGDFPPAAAKTAARNAVKAALEGLPKNVRNPHGGEPIVIERVI